MSSLAAKSIRESLDAVEEHKKRLETLSATLSSIEAIKIKPGQSLAEMIDKELEASTMWTMIDFMVNEQYRVLHKEQTQPMCCNYTTTVLALAVAQLVKGIYYGGTLDEDFESRINKVDILKLSTQSPRCCSDEDHRFEYLAVHNKPKFTPLPTYWLVRALFEHVEAVNHIERIIWELRLDIVAKNHADKYNSKCQEGKCIEDDDRKCRCEEDSDQRREECCMRVRQLFDTLTSASELVSLRPFANEALGGRTIECRDFKITVLANEDDERKFAERKALQDAEKRKRDEEELERKRKYAAQNLKRAKKAMAALNNPKKTQSK